jgi:cation transport regulator
MPYNKVSELPESVKGNLPQHAQEIYQAAFNNAWDQYDEARERRGDNSREETAHSVAWAAVKRDYEKDDATGKWHKKQ